MISTRIAGQPVRLPDPDRIDVPAVRDALLEATELAGHADDNGPREVALLQRLRDVVLAEREAWASKATRNAELAIHKLSRAIDLAEEARDDLRDAVGVAGMLARLRGDSSSPLVLVEQPYGYRFDLAPGIRGLLEALAAVSGEVAALNDAQTRDDTSDEGASLSEAHSPAQGPADPHRTTTTRKKDA